MGNGSSSSSSSKPSSSGTNDNNVSKLSLSAEQQQLANKIGGPSRFCDDVLLDALHFLRRTEHAHVRLASRRLLWLSNVACARYPPRVVPRLEMTGVSVLNNGVPTANSMRVHPSSGGGKSYLADFPTVEPPDDIGHLSRLEISDIVGPEVLHFLRISARLLGECYIFFIDFDNFVRHHSIDFVAHFFALFPSGSNRTVALLRLSSLATPLFLDHPAMFDCVELRVHCLDSFPLDTLQCWLHLDEQQPLVRHLDRRLLFIVFSHNIAQGDRSIALGNFMQKLKQHFLGATSCCPFLVLLVGVHGVHPHTPELLDPFVEDNERTGEQLEFSRLLFFQGGYRIKRKRRVSTAAVAGQDEGTTTAELYKKTKVYIREVVQGDKQQQPLDPAAEVS